MTDKQRRCKDCKFHRSGDRVECAQIGENLYPDACCAPLNRMVHRPLSFAGKDKTGTPVMHRSGIWVGPDFSCHLWEQRDG
jgi:hypothetical protein